MHELIKKSNSYYHRGTLEMNEKTEKIGYRKRYKETLKQTIRLLKEKKKQTKSADNQQSIEQKLKELSKELKSFNKVYDSRTLDAEFVYRIHGLEKLIKKYSQ